MHAPYWPARLGRLAVVLLVAMTVPLGTGRPPLVQAGSSLSFTSSSVTVSGATFSVAVGDFNGDGKLDLAVATTSNTGGGVVNVLLGNGDGSYQSAVSYPVGNSPYAAAVGDFNGDGTLDLAVANANSNSVSALLGNGDGTFQSARSYPVGFGPHSVAVGDFNGDGTLDLATANGNSVSVLLGNRDGIFQPAVSYPVGTSAWSVAVGDFNGDGKPDLASANSNSSSVSVLLGKGDGTFQPAMSYAVGSGPQSVAVGDFNGDGRLDLAAANSSSSNVSVLLGNGDGTFQPARSYVVDIGPTSVAVGDFNGDGTLDLATANHSSVSVLLGNGDGTFQSALNYATGTAHLSVAVGDLNGDARPDLVTATGGSSVGVLLNTTLFPQTITFPSVANHTFGDALFAVLATASSGLPVSFAVGATDTCTIAGNLVTITGAGSCTVTASQPGNTLYGAALPVARTFSIVPAPLTITANDKTMSDGGPLPVFDVSYSGFIDGEDSSVVAGLSCGTTATAGSPPGQYPITCSGASATNYTISYRPGTLTIQPVQTTPPSTSASGATAHGSPYTFGTWTNDAPVQVTLTASDTGGGESVTTYYAVDTAACSASVTGNGCSIYSGPFTVAGDGSHTVTFFSVDQAGNVEPAHSVLVMIDTTPPQTSASVAGTVGNAGWYTSPAQVTLQPSDPGGSGVATTYAGIDDPTCSPASLASLPSAACVIYTGPLSVGDGTHIVYFFSVDIAGNAEQQESQPVIVDTQPPTGVTPQPSRDPDSNGWYNHAFSVSWTGLDSGSGLASCTTGSTYNGPDTTGGSVTGTCTDVAGNTSAPVPLSFQYDGTKPALSPAVSPNPAILNGSATANPGATDNLSGVAQSSCAPLDLTSVGTKSVACTATDIAGNSNSASVSYSVEYAPVGTSCDGSPQPSDPPADQRGQLKRVQAGEHGPGKVPRLRCAGHLHWADKLPAHGGAVLPADGNLDRSHRHGRRVHVLGHAGSGVPVGRDEPAVDLQHEHERTHVGYDVLL